MDEVISESELKFFSITDSVMGDEIVIKFFDLMDVVRLGTVNSRFRRKLEDVKGEVGFVRGFNQRLKASSWIFIHMKTNSFLGKIYGSQGLIKGFTRTGNTMQFSLDDILKPPLVNIGESADFLTSYGNLFLFVKVPNECFFIVNPFGNVGNVVKFITPPTSKSVGVAWRDRVKLIVDKEDMGLGHFRLLYAERTNETLKFFEYKSRNDVWNISVSHNSINGADNLKINDGRRYQLDTGYFDTCLLSFSKNKCYYVSPDILKTFNDLEPPRPDDPDWKLVWSLHYDDVWVLFLFTHVSRLNPAFGLVKMIALCKLTDDWKNYELVSSVLDDKLEEINKGGQAVHKVMDFMVMDGTVNVGLASRIGDTDQNLQWLSYDIKDQSWNDITTHPIHLDGFVICRSSFTSRLTMDA